MIQISKERAQEILSHFAEKKNFQGIKEYSEWLYPCLNGCVTMEIEYILKKSYEDSDAPISYEDLDEKKREAIKESEVIERLARETKDGEKRTEEEIKNALDDVENPEHDYFIDEADRVRDELIDEMEIYEWHVISDPLLYELEKLDEIILDGKFWGRRTTGQLIEGDYIVEMAFKNWLERR